jgi:hypothetical protein
MLVGGHRHHAGIAAVGVTLPPPLLGSSSTVSEGWDTDTPFSIALDPPRCASIMKSPATPRVLPPLSLAVAFYPRQAASR